MLELSERAERLTKRTERALRTLAGPDQSAPLLTQGHVMATPQSTVTYKDIPEHPGYRAGDDGSIWSRHLTGAFTAARGLNFAHFLADWHQVQGSRTSEGYREVTLTVNGRKVRRLVHHLIVIAFIGPIPSKREVNHKDGNKSNNRVENLEICTHRENALHAVRTGLAVLGERSGVSTLTEEIVLRVVATYKPGVCSQAKTAKLLGINKGQVQSIVEGKTWRWLTGITPRVRQAQRKP